MTSTVQDVKSIALSGTDTITVTLPTTGKVPVSLKVGAAARYAAVAGTSGLSLAFSYSNDGGNTWTAAPETALVVAPAANTLGYGEKKLCLVGPNKQSSVVGINAVKIVATNLDGTNAVVAAIVTELSDII